MAKKTESEQAAEALKKAHAAHKAAHKDTCPRLYDEAAQCNCKPKR